MSSGDVVRDAIAAEIAKLTPLVRTPVAEGYGVDLVCVDDIDPRFDETATNTTQSLAQDCYHRVSTAKGAIPDDPDYGCDLRRYLSRATSANELPRIADEVAGEIKKDDRVNTVEVAVTLATLKEMRVTIRVTPQDPEIATFTLIIAVTSADVLLEAIQ